MTVDFVLLMTGTLFGGIASALVKMVIWSVGNTNLHYAVSITRKLGQ